MKNMPAVQEIRVRSLVWEDPLEKGMSTHSKVLAWTIPQTEESRGLQSMGLQRVGHDGVINTPQTISLWPELPPPNSPKQDPKPPFFPEILMVQQKPKKGRDSLRGPTDR